MKKWIAVGILICLLFLVPSGRGTEPKEAIGKTFIYERGGFAGDFTIRIKDDGTFQYYEGLTSSYIGFGCWRIEDRDLILSDELFSNRFLVKKGKLIWKEEGSDNFMYIRLEDGAEFFERINRGADVFLNY